MLPEGANKFEDALICFDTVHERVRRTDGQTPHDNIGRAMNSVAQQNALALRQT